MRDAKTNKIICSFCERVHKRARNHPDFYSFRGKVVCDPCAEKLLEVRAQIRGEQDGTASEVTAPRPKTSTKTLSAREIVSFLDSKIVGQDRAKKDVALAIFNHSFRIKNRDHGFSKSNILVMGPTGTGKTAIAQAIASELGIPFAIASGARITPNGFSGMSVQDLFIPLLDAANWDVKKAETGILFVDEIDKMMYQTGASQNENFRTVEVQKECLDALEGTKLFIEPKRDKGKTIVLDTTNILIIGAGAFAPLEKIVLGRFGKGGMMGLSATSGCPSIRKLDKPWQTYVSRSVLVEDLGVMPEFIGRFPVITYTDSLSEADFVKILKDVPNPEIEFYKKLCEENRIEFEFCDSFYHSIAKEALREQIGARGLKTILQRKLGDFNFNVCSFSGQKIVFTADGVINFYTANNGAAGKNPGKSKRHLNLVPGEGQAAEFAEQKASADATTENEADFEQQEVAISKKTDLDDAA